MSLAVLYSRALSGMDAALVTVEVHLANGLPSFTIVGLPEAEVKESKDRVRAALQTCQFEFPYKHITVNLAPADLPKESGRFDLPIALGILAASGQIPAEHLSEYEFAGELALTGELRPIRGALAMTYHAANCGRAFILPEANAAEAALVEDATVYAAQSLLQVAAHLSGRELMSRYIPNIQPAPPIYPDMREVKGQGQSKRALEIAAAGGHSILMSGPPGTGKSMLAARFPGILPHMSETEALESAAMQSLGGMFDVNRWKQRPYRSPHHTASAVALVGGGCAKQRALKCPFCGFVEEIAPAAGKVEEHDFQAALQKQVTATSQIAGRSQEVRCTGCGAMVLLEDNVVTDQCPFCTTHLENLPKVESAATIAPESLLPFRIASRDAIDAFNKWLATRWFAPADLKKLANLGQLAGIYLPYWTYDSMTYSHYSGQRGDDYWETETYTETENGQSVTKTRQVRKTRWTYVSGEVDHFFDDVLVCGSKSLPGNFVDKLCPWDLQDIEGFRSDYLAGFKTERYVVDLAEGFGVARGIMDGEIQTLVRQDIGGDHQQISSVNTQHVGVTFKHLLLPVWLAVYRYQGTLYRIAVNARTAEVTGTRPYSVMKIVLLVLAILIVVGIIVALASAHR